MSPNANMCDSGLVMALDASPRRHQASGRVAMVLEQFESEMRVFDAEVKTRTVKEVLEDDRTIVQRLVCRFLEFLHACKANGLSQNAHDDDAMKVIGLFGNIGIAIFKGPAFDGLECKVGEVLLKVHLFPPDSDETLWHNHGQNFFSCNIGRSGRYWHRFGELQADCSNQTYKFEKKGDGDPCFQGEESGAIQTMVAHSHQPGSMYFIDARAKHTVHAEAGTGPVLTCVLQAGQKTNATTIFKSDQAPIRGNFRPRDKNLSVESNLEIMKAITAEIVELDTVNPCSPQAMIGSKFIQKDAPRTNRRLDEAAHASCISLDGSFVVTEHSRPPKSAKVRCVLCHLVVADRKALREHEKTFHVTSDFRCCGCNSSFKASEDLRKHSRKTSHSIPRAFCLEGHMLTESESSDCSVTSQLLVARCTGASSSSHFQSRPCGKSLNVTSAGC